MNMPIIETTTQERILEGDVTTYIDDDTGRAIAVRLPSGETLVKLAAEHWHAVIAAMRTHNPLRVRFRCTATMAGDSIVSAVCREIAIVEPPPPPDPEDPPEGECQRLAKEDPRRLLELVSVGKLRSLTFAAEMLGDCELPVDEVAAALTKLLDHPSAIVREGAIMGLEKRILCDEVIDAIIRLLGVSSGDSSQVIRECAGGVLRGLIEAKR